MNENLFQRTRNKLKLEHYLMNDDWLRDCMEYYVQEHPNSSEKEILEFVKVQWQLSDLREINNEHGSLPPNISAETSKMLLGTFILQMEQMYDIATSKYKQLEQIRNSNYTEVDAPENEQFENREQSKKRMMYLRLTDGVQDVIGIEYNYIPQFNDMLLPGYKVMIIGPINCHRGVLFLKEGKLKGIGGEVDKLLIPNALENVLARALNLQENPDPYNDNVSKPAEKEQQENAEEQHSFFEDDFEVNFDEVSRIENLHQINDGRPVGNQQLKKDIEPENLNTDIDCADFEEAMDVQTYSDVAKVESESCIFKDEVILDDDDFLLEMVDEKRLVEPTEQRVNVPAPFKVIPKEPTSINPNDDIVVISDEESSTEPESWKYPRHEMPTPESKPSFSNRIIAPWTNTSIPKVSTEQGTSSSLVGTKRSAIQVSSPDTAVSKKGRIEKKITQFMQKPGTSQDPKICEFIRDVIPKLHSDAGIKRIRGHVDVHGKLSKSHSCWILEATVSDGIDKLEVSFSNQVLENLLGFSVQEFSRKKKLKKNNPEIEHELRMSFRSAEQKLKTLDALLDLEISREGMPKVIDIINLTDKQKEIIDRQIKCLLEKR